MTLGFALVGHPGVWLEIVNLRNGVDLDIFYYWKDFVSDVNEGRIGTLGAESDKLTELQARPPRTAVFGIATRSVCRRR